MLDEKQTGLLRDILDSARQIRTYLAGTDFEAFERNLEKQDAVLRRFEIIGEAASRLSPETQALFPDLPRLGHALDFRLWDWWQIIAPGR